MSSGKWFNAMASLIKNPKNGNFFVKFARRTDKEGNPIGDNPYPVTFNEGDILKATLKRDDLAGLVKDGKMTQEIADKICETVKFEFHLGPPTDKSPKKPTGKPKGVPPSSDDDIAF
jgi:hypothetical protein